MRAALVLGGASCVWDDVDALEAMVGRWRGPVLAVNDIACRRDVQGRAWERRIDHFCTLHAEKLARWKLQRRELVFSLGRSPDWDFYQTWSCTKRTVADHHFAGLQNGSSAQYAVSVALHLGYQRIVLAGAPLDPRPNAFRNEERWRTSRKYTDAWIGRDKKALPEMAAHVRSMSGWTREILGAPDREWIEGEQAAA